MAGPEIVLKFSAVGASEVSSAIRTVQAGMASLGSAIGGLIPGVGTAVGVVSKLTTALLLVPQAIESSIRLIEGLGRSFFDFTVGTAAAAEPLIDISEGFVRITGSAGAAEEAIKKLRIGTGGAVKDIELMRMANRALSLGLIKNVDDLQLLLGAVKQASGEVGKGFPEAFQALNRALQTGRLNLLSVVLPQFRGIAEAQELARNQAKEHGVELSKQQERVVGITKAMEIAAPLYARFASSEKNAAQEAVALEISLSNFSDQFTLAFGKSNELRAALELLGQTIGGNTGEFQNWGSELGVVFSSIAADTTTLVSENLPLILQFGESVVSVTKDLTAVLGDAAPALVIVGKILVDVGAALVTFTAATAGVNAKMAALALSAAGLKEIADNVDKFADSTLRLVESVPKAAEQTKKSLDELSASAPKVFESLDKTLGKVEESIRSKKEEIAKTLSGGAQPPTTNRFLENAIRNVERDFSINIRASLDEESIRRAGEKVRAKTEDLLRNAREETLDPRTFDLDAAFSAGAP